MDKDREVSEGWKYTLHVEGDEVTVHKHVATFATFEDASDVWFRANAGLITDEEIREIAKSKGW